MKGHLILLTVLVPIIFSCRNEKKQETNSTTKQETQKVSDSFNWTKALSLKTKMISELENKTEPNDKIIAEFLNEYTKIQEEMNDHLQKQSNYDSLNTIIYSDKKNIKQCALDFEKKVEINGFRIASAEAMIYITKNSDFVKSKTLELVDPISIEFLDLYFNEIDKICCEDAGLIITRKELVERIYKWGELLDKSSGLAYNKIIEDEFLINLSLLFRGQDNTRAFDFGENKYNQESLDLMKEIIIEYPNSRATKEFKNYIELLTKENFSRTKKIEEFFEEKFK
jgi:hypothetical protein